MSATRIWGFDAPSDAKAKLVFNTRIETALTHAGARRGMWAEPIDRGRCLVPALSFYESWTRNPPRRGAQARFCYPGHKAFLLAGVQQGDRVSIVTTEPNADVSPLHSRMPLVLGPGESSVWLGPDFARLADRSAVRLEVHELALEDTRGPQTPSLLGPCAGRCALAPRSAINEGHNRRKRMLHTAEFLPTQPSETQNRPSIHWLSGISRKDSDG